MSMMPRGVLNMPEKIGNYEVQSVIGEGTMGVVYKGKDPKLNRFVALKTIHKHLLTGPDDRLVKRSYAEAQALGGLNHANIVTIHDLVEFEGMPVIVMEFAEGRTLYDYLVERTKVSVRDAIKIISQVLDALEYAHGRRLIHRDIKPANIMIRDRASIKVMDFGVAKIQDSDVTLRGEVFGAPNYMSPEQWRGKDVDARTDIFAMGVLFYQLLTGVKPFEGENFHQTRENILTVDPDPPSRINPTIPAELNEIVMKAMARERENRYQSAAEFRQALELAEQSMTLPPKEPTLPGVKNSDGSYRPTIGAKRPPWLIPASGVGIAVVLTVGGWLWSSKPVPVALPVPPPPVAKETIPPPLPKDVKPISGRAQITSEPRGAKVALTNGELLGITPITVTKEPGYYQIILTKEGFEETKLGMDISGDKEGTLNVTLKAIPSTPVIPPQPVAQTPPQLPPTAEVTVPQPKTKPSAPSAPIVEPAPPASSPREMQRSIRQILDRAGHRSVKAHVNKDYVVALSGTVKTEQGKDDVLGLANAVGGIKEIIDRGLRVSHAEEDARTKLAREIRTKLRGYKVAIAVLPNYRVVLSGKLASQEQIDTVVQTVQGTQGVTGVVNRLKAALPSRPQKTEPPPTSNLDKLVASINSSLRNYKLQDTGEVTNIRAKQIDANTITLTGSAKNGDQAKAAMEVARKLAGNRMQVKNEITVLH